MKRILFYLCCLILPAAGTSCSNDDDNIIDGSKETFSFREPLTTWTVTQAEVMDYMSGYTLASTSVHSLIYEGKDSESSYLYAFADSDGTLTYAVVTFDLSFSDEVSAFLSGKYKADGYSDGRRLYHNDDGSTVIFTSSDKELYLTYMSASKMSR